MWRSAVLEEFRHEEDHALIYASVAKRSSAVLESNRMKGIPCCCE